MKHARYTAHLEPIAFPGKKFYVCCADPVIRMQVEDHITAQGGILSVNAPDYAVYNTNEEMPADKNCVMLTYIQFWMASSELDRIQKHEWVEASIAYLGSDSVFTQTQEQKILWYIRDNRETIITRMLTENITEAVEGYLTRRRLVLPEAFEKIAESGAFEDQILLDLIDELIEQASKMDRHELTAWLLDYKQTHLSGDFVEEIQQLDMEKELGFRDRNEYDWMKLFSFTNDENGIHISEYKGTDELVFIPDMIAGKDVTSIHIRNFFAEKRNLQFFWQRPEYLGSSFNMDALRNAETGDTVCFGRYPQTKAADMNPIEWLVLKKDDKRLLVISCLCLDKLSYQKEYEGTDWENCDLRRWLNGPFYQLCFTPEEQDMIPKVTLPNLPNEKYKTSGGRDTADHVFALTSGEASALFPSDESRIGRTTAYHQVQGYFYGGLFNCWWLRTPGVEHEFVTLVGNSGSVGLYGERVDNNEYAVRPAMWIEIGG